MDSEKTIEIVTRVTDGDTFVASRYKPPVRLANVNAPELGTKEGEAAKSGLENLIGDKMVSIDTVATGPYDRRVAWVEVDGQPVNALMVRMVAWLEALYRFFP